MKIYLVVLCLLSAGISRAQRLEEKSIPWQAGQAIQLDLKYAHDIQVHTRDQHDLSVRVSITLNDNTRNEAWSMATETTADRIRVTSDIEEPQESYEDPCEGRNYHLDGHSYCSLIVYDIYVPEAASLHVETLGGDITIQGAQAPVYAKSLSGFVDVDWSARQGATVSMKSITGEVYSNLDLALEEPFDPKHPRRSPVGWEIEGTVAG